MSEESLKLKKCSFLGQCVAQAPIRGTLRCSVFVSVSVISALSADSSISAFSAVLAHSAFSADSEISAVSR